MLVLNIILSQTDGDITKKYCSTSVYNNKQIKSLK